MCLTGYFHIAADCEVEGRGRRSILTEGMWSEELLVRVARLEEKAGVCQFNNEVYPHGSSWGLGRCTTCSCKVGNTIIRLGRRGFSWVD